MDNQEPIQIIQLPKVIDLRGNLSFFEENSQIPFKFKRVYWVYDVPGGEFRGSHAFKKTKEFIVALSGSFDLVLHDGKKEINYHLNRSYYGVYIPELTWKKLENFSTNSTALIISSEYYDVEDYIRNFEKFIELKNQ
jgi:hypothetical protein